MTLTVTDFFCGAGGSSSGMETVPGVRVRMASNHWTLAVDTHNANLPHADHDCADVFGVHPARYPHTDLAWFSPECTTWSQARGEECDYDARQLDLLDEEPESDEAKQRSRLQMDEVVRFVRHHHYRGFVVENVGDILKWWDLDRWIRELRAEGYEHRIVTLNSAFAHALGAPAPQLRDRVYFVFWRTGYQTPDLDKWTRPRAWCPTCGQVVTAVYAPKPGKRRPMRYGQQYTYRCPATSCRNAVVQPYVLPAAAAIDWALPAQRIGDRTRPLQPKTLARIEAGLRRYARPALVPSGGTWRDEATPVDVPMPTRTARENDGLAFPPFLIPLRSGRPRVIGADQPLATVVANGSNHALVEPLLIPVEGRDNLTARGVSQPARAQTARLQDALVVPLRNNVVARQAVDYPLPTFAAAGQHHALIMRNMTARGDQGQMSTALDEPLRTILAEQRQSLVAWDHLVYAYDAGNLHPLTHPLPTQTTVEGDALLGTAIRVEDCTFRMLDVHEIKAGMAFDRAFLMPYGAKRDKVRMLGNAVTPPAARDLIAALVEAITGDPIDRARAAA